MIVDSIAISDFDVFSKIDKDLDKKNNSLSEFFRWAPELGTLNQIIQTRNPAKKAVVAEVLSEQYADIPGANAAIPLIAKLKQANAFTVCTAHQPCLFGGPLFVISKALSTIKLARQIQEQHPEVTIIPFFVIGSEDHDVAELNHTYVNGQKIEWKTLQQGPVGRFKNEEIYKCIEEVKNLLPGNGFDHKLISLLDAAYSKEKTIAQSFQMTRRTMSAA